MYFDLSISLQLLCGQYNSSEKGKKNYGDSDQS